MTPNGAPAPLARKKRAANLPRIVALNIKDDRADRLVRELAAATGESLTTAITVAVTERLERVRGAPPRARRAAAMIEIAERSARRPVLDARSADEIIGYDADGLPT